MSTYKLLTPGPLTTTMTVKEQMLFDHYTWDDDYKAITQQIRAKLLELAHVDVNRYTTVLMQGSGTFGDEAVIFDWAGTTVDYGCFAPVQAFMETFKAAGVEPTMEETRKPMGMLKIDHIRTMLHMERIEAEWERVHGVKPTEMMFISFTNPMKNACCPFCITSLNQNLKYLVLLLLCERLESKLVQLRAITTK